MNSFSRRQFFLKKPRLIARILTSNLIVPEGSLDILPLELKRSERL